MTAEELIVDRMYGTKLPEEILKFEKLETVRTGIGKLDRMFGWPPGVYVVAASPGSGKSWFATWFARQMWLNHGKRSAYLFLETTTSFVTQRILQQWSDLTKEEFESGASTRKAYEAMKQDAILAFEVSPKMTKPDVLERIISKQIELGFETILFDHIHEVTGMSDNKENQRLSEALGSVFKRLAVKYPHARIIIFAQPTKSGYNKNLLSRSDVKGMTPVIEKCDYFLSLNRVVERDGRGNVVYTQDDDKIMETIIYLEKTRKTAMSHIMTTVRFIPTANFEDFV